MTDKADDKNTKTAKKSSTGLRSKSKTTDKRKADDLPENSVSQDASFSGDNENDDDDNYQPPSKRTRSEAFTSVSLELFTISWENWTRDFQFRVSDSSDAFLRETARAGSLRWQFRRNCKVSYRSECIKRCAA